MSRRTKLLITVLFLVLLAIPVIYIALTWNPDAPLQFRVEYLAPPAKENPAADRKLRVSIKNTSPTPVHFYGATMTADRMQAVMPELYPGKVVPGHDLMPGVVTPQLLKGDTPLDAEYKIDLPPFLIFTFPIGESLLIPAGSTVHVAAILPPELVDATQPRDLFVHYHWETRTHVKAKNFTQWLRHHTPPWAQSLIPLLWHRQDTARLQGRGR